MTVTFADHADYKDSEAPITMVCSVRDEGVRIGMQSTEPWYGAGVLIPRTHPAYQAALNLTAVLAEAAAQERTHG